MSQPTPASRQLVVVPCRPDDVGAKVLAEWWLLFDQQAGIGNPFMAPTWVLGWFARFVSSGDGRLLLVRSPGGELVGVAAVHRQRIRVARAPVTTRLVPVGAGVGPTALELPGLLARAGQERMVVRAVAEATMRLVSGWCEISLAPEQGWFEPEWVYDVDGAVAFQEHQRARACVIFRPGLSWDATRATLKRNVKESVRRSQNRLKKSGRDWAVVPRTGADLDLPAVNRFLELHRARSGAAQATVVHHDAYASPRERGLLRDVLPELGARRLATLFELEIAGAVVASQLALQAPRCTYVHSSGFDPDSWHFGPVTLLHAEVVKHAISCNDEQVNFSPGPNVSKLRWSEELAVHNDFAYGSGSRPMSYGFLAHKVFSTVRSHERAVAFAATNNLKSARGVSGEAAHRAGAPAPQP